MVGEMGENEPQDTAVLLADSAIPYAMWGGSNSFLTLVKIGSCPREQDLDHTSL